MPPAGGITTIVTPTNDAPTLLQHIPFNVDTLSIFNVTTQYWMTYTPGAPDWLNASFREHLDAGAIIWVRRSPSDGRGGIDWRAAGAIPAPGHPTLPVPPPGRISAGLAGVTSVPALIAAQPFEVRSVFAFDIAQQRYVSYFPTAPAWANSLATDGLQPTSVVWVSRSPSDPNQIARPEKDVLAGGVQVARAAVSVSWDTGAPSGQPEARTATQPAAQPAAKPAQAPAGTKPSPAPTQTAAPAKPAATATPAPAVPARVAGGSPAVVDGAKVFRHLTYESGERAMTSEQAPPNGIGRTTESARSGSSAGFSLLRPGDPQSKAGGYRSEWHGSDHISGPGAERWHGISYYFPKDYNQGSNSSTFNDRIIFQFCDEGSPMFSLHLDAAREQLWVRRKLPERDSNGKPRFETLGRWDFQVGQWYDIVFHAKWTKDGSGFMEVYVDGQQVVNYRGRTLAERDVTYSKWGIYGQPTRVLYDEVWAADGSGTLASIRP